MGLLAGTHSQPGIARGRSRLPDAAREALQRARLQRAIVACVAEKGFASCSVSDIVSSARVSRQTFYELYDDKESCLLDAADAGWALLRTRMAAARRAADPDDAWSVLTAMVDGYLGFLADEPEFTRLFEIDMLTAGQRSLRGRLAAHRRLAAVVQDWHTSLAVPAGWPPLPAPAFLALIGAIDSLVIAEVAAGRTAELRGQRDVILDITHRFLSGTGR